MANVSNSFNTHLVSCVHWIIATDFGGQIGETCNCIAINVLLCNHQSKSDNKLILNKLASLVDAIAISKI